MDESADSSENRKGDSSAEVSATATVLQGGGLQISFSRVIQ
jgi:hypothetical protein